MCWIEVAAQPRFRARPLTHAARAAAWAGLRLLRAPERFRVGGPGARYRFKMDSSAGTGRLGAEAFILRECCEPALAHLCRLVRPGDRAMDCGAGLGIYALAMASLVGPAGRVLAAEIDPNLAEAVRLNAELNGFHQVDVFDGAIHHEVARFAACERPAAAGRRAIAVEAASIDALMYRGGFDRLDLLKLDLAGTEAAALAGAAATIRAHRPIIVFDVKDPASGAGLAVRRALTRMNYQVFSFTSDGALAPFGWDRREFSAVALGPDRASGAAARRASALTA